MLTSVHSTSPSASSRSVDNSGSARSPCVVHTPSALLCGITCQIGSSMLAVAPSSKARRKKLAGQIDLADAGRQRLLHVDHRLVGDPDCGAHAGQLVRRFDRLGGADDGAGVDGSTVGEQQVRRTRHRAGTFVDGDRRPRPESGRPARARNPLPLRRIRGRPGHARDRRATPIPARRPRGTAGTGAATRRHRPPRPPAARRRTARRRRAANWCRWRRQRRCCPTGSARRRRGRPSPTAAGPRSPGASGRRSGDSGITAGVPELLAARANVVTPDPRTW